MNTCKEMLVRAKADGMDAAQALVNMYRPLMIKASFVDGRFDEDLYQELQLTVLHCIDCFQLPNL